jgi:hypothetical protein
MSVLHDLDLVPTLIELAFLAQLVRARVRGRELHGATLLAIAPMWRLFGIFVALDALTWLVHGATLRAPTPADAASLVGWFLFAAICWGWRFTERGIEMELGFVPWDRVGSYAWSNFGFGFHILRVRPANWPASLFLAPALVVHRTAESRVDALLRERVVTAR